MRFSSTIVTLAACLHHHFGCTRAAPARTTDEVLLGEVDIAVRDDNSNEVTLKPFEKKCVVDGKTYSHAQAVSHDANSRCICVAGNVYCFWHGLPGSSDADPAQREDNVDGDDSDSSPTSTEQPSYKNSSMPTESVDQSPPPAPSDGQVPTRVYKNIDDAKSKGDDDDGGDDDDAANEDYQRYADASGSEESTGTTVTTLTNNSPATPVTCVVLDRRYRVGEVLPHNTGNCVECSCGPEGHVVCAPRDCVSIVPHRDYREESFQIPVAGDLRGIDENF